MGFSLTKMKRYHEAEAEFWAVIWESEHEMFEVHILSYVWKSYEWLASLFYEVLAFKTAKEFLSKASDIINQYYEPSSFEFLDFKKKQALYFKKF